MKRSISVEGWTVELRVRTQRKKRKVNGRTRGRYEGKTAYVTVRAPGGETKSMYVGSGANLGGRLVERGEERDRGRGSRASLEENLSGGGMRGPKPLGADLASVSPLYKHRRYFR